MATFGKSSWTYEERPESEEQSVAQHQVRRPLASPAQNDQVLFEQKMLAITARTPLWAHSVTIMTAR